ncbi:DUF5134 domain-containing protein [Pseudonocardia bannensis]|uniref:DUF5134 domain-containing protein n=1 Tax=Pseudonocardia bannensis TaxID=630973 RepID=A0A848DJ87_9PSEU|nr:DUF5134 domain-containing protein [Pseudonocardia bannensis]NMH92767.1 DUF5134 domain-containing protein [Pseudonocardia bannensis]
MARTGEEGQVHMEWLSGFLAIVCLVLGVLHIIRLVALRTDVVGEGSHAAMGFGMAAMFSPLGDPVPAPVWTTVFVLTAAWFAALALRSGFGTADAGHHVICSGAMLFMLLTGAHRHGAGAGHAAGHSTHAEVGGFGLASVAAIVLVGYFAWHVLRCIDRVSRPDRCAGAAASPRPAADGGGAVALRPVRLSLRTPRTAAVAHLVMGGAMTVMLLGMV